MVTAGGTVSTLGGVNAIAGTFDPSEIRFVAALERFERAIAADPAVAESCDHQIALARAALARVAYERGDDEAAADATSWPSASFSRAL